MNQYEGKPVKSCEVNNYHQGKGSGASPKKPSKVSTSTRRTNGNMPKR